MPEEGVMLSQESKLLTTEEIVRLARLFISQGVTKIRLTGGEPTVRKDLLKVVEGLGNLRAEGLEVLSMTTNGIVLKRMLKDLQKLGMSQLNISLDTLDPLKFELITRRKGFEKVVESIEESLRMDFQSVKVNVVVTRGVNENEVPDFVELTRAKKLNIRFIEYMPFDGNKWSEKKLVPYPELIGEIEKRFGKLERLKDDANDTTKNYKVPGFVGKLGFITSMTDHFCGTCNRTRITADGNFKVCLFGAAEVSLRDAIREGKSDEELLTIIGVAVKRKRARHAGMFELSQMKNRPMILIGG